MRKAFPLEGWKRKDHFEFFKSFDEPFFGLTPWSTDLTSRNSWSFFKAFYTTFQTHNPKL